MRATRGVFRRIERFHTVADIAKEINGYQLMTFIASDDKMIISDLYHSFAINWIVDGKINDLYYYTTPILMLRPAYKDMNAGTFKRHVDVVQENQMKVDVVKDNPFFSIILSPIFDSPIKKRILQFLSYLHFESSVSHMMPWLNSSFFLERFVKNLQYKKSEIQ